MVRTYECMCISPFPYIQRGISSLCDSDTTITVDGSLNSNIHSHSVCTYVNSLNSVEFSVCMWQVVCHVQQNFNIIKTHVFLLESYFLPIPTKCLLSSGWLLVVLPTQGDSKTEAFIIKVYQKVTL
jgi:hypothetical protein